MSGSFRQRTTCQHCGRLTSTEDDFGKWSREKCGKQLSVQDVDYIIHRFISHEDNLSPRAIQYMMIVETKTRSADMDDPQRDSLLILDELMRTHPRGRERVNGKLQSGHSENPITLKINGMYGKRAVRLYGVHKVRMDGTRPDNSTWITWDNKPVTEDQLIKLLRFELHPDSLKPMSPRRHKRKRQPERKLF